LATRSASGLAVESEIGTSNVTSTQQLLRLGEPLWMKRTRGRTQCYLSLSGNHETSVAIVGGGMTVALVAHGLPSAGVATIVLEAIPGQRRRRQFETARELRDHFETRLPGLATVETEFA
jgi:hypothetical protein